MAVFTFLEKHDIAGKTIVPFCTYGGSYFCESINNIKKLCPDSTVLEGLAVRDSDVKNVTNSNIFVWWQKIGFSDKS
ncbi:flavodoxin [Candidatus Endomicrobiellum pyrsonymphae]|uniref:flavodoxin n=1 Tax=Candidatus Endomicrobiellum pyrsonymphae TaxID=1408203 RepID=UPI0035A9914D